MKRAIPLGTRITDRAADLYARNAAQALGGLSTRYGLERRHAPIVATAYEAGASFELERLSRILGVDLRSAQAAAKAGAKTYFKHIFNHWGPDLCSLDGWRQLLDGAFRSGAGFVHAYLWPPQPKNPRRKSTAAYWKKRAPRK